MLLGARGRAAEDARPRDLSQVKVLNLLKGMSMLKGMSKLSSFARLKRRRCRVDDKLLTALSVVCVFYRPESGPGRRALLKRACLPGGEAPPGEVAHALGHVEHGQGHEQVEQLGAGQPMATQHAA